jgi:hypothetical protein
LKYYKAYRDGKWEIYNEYMDPLFDRNFTRLERIGKKQYLACDGKCGVISVKGDTVLPFKYSNLLIFDQREDSYIVYFENDLVGLMDFDFQQITAPKYKQVNISEVGYYVYDTNGYYGFLNRNGEQITDVKYSQGLPKYLGGGVYSVGYRHENYKELGYIRAGTRGWIDTLGNEIGEIKYDYVYPFVNGFAIAAINRKKGLVNRKGEELTPFKYDKIREELYGYRIVELNRRYGLIDRFGNEVVEPKFISYNYDGDSGVVFSLGDEKVELKF